MCIAILYLKVFQNSLYEEAKLNNNSKNPIISYKALQQGIQTSVKAFLYIPNSEKVV